MLPRRESIISPASVDDQPPSPSVLPETNDAMKAVETKKSTEIKVDTIDVLKDGELSLTPSELDEKCARYKQTVNNFYKNTHIIYKSLIFFYYSLRQFQISQ